jgi:hypothetical protein
MSLDPTAGVINPVSGAKNGGGEYIVQHLLGQTPTRCGPGLSLGVDRPPSLPPDPQASKPPKTANTSIITMTPFTSLILNVNGCQIL